MGQGVGFVSVEKMNLGVRLPGSQQTRCHHKVSTQSVYVLDMWPTRRYVTHEKAAKQTPETMTNQWLEIHDVEKGKDIQLMTGNSYKVSWNVETSTRSPPSTNSICQQTLYGNGSVEFIRSSCLWLQETPHNWSCTYVCMYVCIKKTAFKSQCNCKGSRTPGNLKKKHV